MSALGGAWAVVASDFMQVLTLMPITIVAAYLALSHPEVGGVTGFYEKLPANNFNFVGPVIWFIPPLAAAIVFADLNDVFPELGEKAFEGAYVAMAIETMPRGMVGLLLCGIFAATMSSMDSGLNRNAGIFVKNFYYPVLRKKASDQELLWAGRIVTLSFGTLVILAALTFGSFKDLPIFDLMLQFGALIALPYSIPLVLGMFVKRVPSWAAWTTVLIGFGVSFLVKNIVDPNLFRSVMGLDGELNANELNFYFYTASVLANTVIAGGWYMFTSRFYNQSSIEAQQRDEAFFSRINAPFVDSDGPENSDELDSRQRSLLGKLCLIYGGFIMLMTLIPNPIEGRLCFLFCGGVVAVTGWCLRAIRA
jgi:Na+/proline symporter